MHFALIQRFVGSLADVETAFLEPEVLARFDRLPHVSRPELLERRDQGNAVRQRVRHRFVGKLSPAAAAVVDPARLTWVQESVLDRSTHRTRFWIQPDHYADRLRCHGTVDVGEADGVTSRLVQAELKVWVPFVGSSVEQSIKREMRRYLEAEADVVQQWINERSAT